MIDTRIKVKAEIVKQVNRCSQTFVDIERIFKMNGYDYKGTIYETPKDYPNIIYWVGWSGEAWDLLHETMRENQLQLKSAPQLLYLMDGKALNLPIVKKVHQYKKEHWLPVVIATNS